MSNVPVRSVRGRAPLPGSTVVDPERGVVTVDVAATAATGGTLRVAFYGGPDAGDRRFVTVTALDVAQAGQLATYVVRDVHHRVTLRLEQLGDRDDPAGWQAARGEHASHHIRRCGRFGGLVHDDRPTDPALRDIIDACTVAADAAVAALPHGWEVARVRCLESLEETQLRAVDRALEAYQAARETLDRTRGDLAAARAVLAEAGHGS